MQNLKACLPPLRGRENNVGKNGKKENLDSTQKKKRGRKERKKKISRFRSAGPGCRGQKKKGVKHSIKTALSGTHFGPSERE